ncbi:MAG: hypothetical protein KAI16_02490 [Candidatus Pacebacteria bacterium]|nr:hypothetical protein [Candidatus Paceibacterota bacterium]
MLRSFFLKFISVLFIFIVLPTFSFAQNNNEIEYRILPNYPAPHESFEIRLNSNYFNLDSSKISFYVDGVLLKQGDGLKNFFFEAGEVGKKMNIKVKIEKFSGGIEIKEIVVNPAEVALAYQVVDPHRPFNYLGKSVALSDSKVNVYAFTNFLNDSGKIINPTDLIYEWYLNYEYDQKSSGIGKNIYRIQRLHAHPRETDITVKVFSRDRKIVAKKDINFAPRRTAIDFYLIDDVLPFNFKNVANPNIKSLNLDTKILAVPYFMNFIPEGVHVEWKINNKPALSPLDNPLQIILSNSLEGFVEKVKIFFRVKNQDRILQSAQRDFLIDFSDENSDTAEEDTVFYNKRKTDSFEESDSFWSF